MALSPERAEEIFASFGPVRIRRMFGGSGVYAGDVMFALEADGALYLKSDDSTGSVFESEGCEPFAYDTRDGRRVITSYRRAPDRLFDDPEEMAEWARRSLSIARTRKTTKRKRESGSKP